MEPSVTVRSYLSVESQVAIMISLKALILCSKVAIAFSKDDTDTNVDSHLRSKIIA